MEREWIAEESIRIEAPPERVYAAVADPRAMTAWSPELFAVWMRGAPAAEGTRFTGFNRRGPFVWFTGCEVTSVVPQQAFDHFASLTPTGRLATPEEVARLVVFLASEANRSVTGAALRIGLP